MSLRELWKKIFIKEIQILKNINSIQFQVMCFQMPEKNFQQKRYQIIKTPRTKKTNLE